MPHSGCLVVVVQYRQYLTLVIDPIVDQPRCARVRSFILLQVSNALIKLNGLRGLTAADSETVS
jgi:hypothetical protein